MTLFSHRYKSPTEEAVPPGPVRPARGLQSSERAQTSWGGVFAGSRARNA